MATNDKRLIVSEFDFDDVKNNLKLFLEAQDEFTDYNFEGSGMSVLLDVLAYNTHYLGFNMNMLANEMFLDSSSLRSSVVSHAKTLGYEPISARAPKAVIDVTLFDSVKATGAIPAGTVFTTSVNDISYQFVTITEFTSASIGSSIPFLNIPIYEGTFITTQYIVDSGDVDQRFILTNNRADTTTLTVTVQTSSSDTSSTTYTKTTDVSQVNATSANFFLQEVENGLFEVYFGDGVLGKLLSDGNIVILTYVVTNRKDANTASAFTNATAIDTVVDVQVSLVEAADGGALPESVDSIKFNAPLDFASQGRCVTAEDYKVFVKRFYPNTQAVSIWGGESGSFNPVTGVSSVQEFGKVFISIRSTRGTNLTASQKIRLVTDLAPFTVASITPVIVDPDTVFLILDVSARFNSNLTSETSDSLESIITNSLTSFNNSNLKSFNNAFRHSQVTGLIDDSNSAIISNITRVVMGKFFTPTIADASGYILNFNNSFYNPHARHNADAGGVVASTGFKVSGDTINEMFFDDDGNGNLRRFFISAGVKTYVDLSAGTVDYTNGVITLKSINIISVSNVDNATSTEIRVTAIPDSSDIIPVRNQLLEIDLVNTVVNVTIDTLSVGDPNSVSTGDLATSSYTTTTSGY
jgi:hypothetical protein